MRYFREETNGIYEQVRNVLDEAWNLPDDKGTETCMRPAASAHRDPQGRIVVALKDFFCDWEPAVSMLPQLLGSGDVSEITESDYRSAVEEPLAL
jgi:hypothetical protein